MTTPCPTCEALARTVMLDQTSHDTPKREWVGLTDEEIFELNDLLTTPQGILEFVSNIEAKLKELNK